MIFCRLVTEDCYPWEGRMTECKVLKKKNELFASCPNARRQTTTQLNRVAPVYKVSSINGIMHEIMTSGSVQGVYYSTEVIIVTVLCNWAIILYGKNCYKTNIYAHLRGKINFFFLFSIDEHLII